VLQGMAGDTYEAEHDQQRAALVERIRGERREDVAGWGAKSKYIRSLPTGTLSFVGVNQVAEYRTDTTGAGLVVLATWQIRLEMKRKSHDSNGCTGYFDHPFSNQPAFALFCQNVIK
jgi:hypothetical protein